MTLIINIFFFAVIFLTPSCGQLELLRKTPEQRVLRTLPKDYEDHLASLAEDYLHNKSIRTHNLNKLERKYLQDVYNNIFINNELLLGVRKKIELFIIKDKTPFYFSLPKGKIFLSSGLIKKYLRNEQLFIAALTNEIIRIHLNVYRKRVIVPTGYLTTKRLLSITSLPLGVRAKLDKWNYYTMRRSGNDPYAFLIWLQVQNKNTLDFSVQFPNTYNISREEYLFKNFIAGLGIKSRETQNEKENSSVSFYRMLRRIQ